MELFKKWKFEKMNITTKQKSSSSIWMSCFSKKFYLIGKRKFLAFIVENKSHALNNLIMIHFNKFLCPKVALAIQFRISIASQVFSKIRSQAANQPLNVFFLSHLSHVIVSQFECLIVVKSRYLVILPVLFIFENIESLSICSPLFICLCFTHLLL